MDKRDIVLEKNNYSAFTNPRLSEYIDDAYLIAGVYSDGGVNATIVEGWSKGYFTYILGKHRNRSHLLHDIRHTIFTW